MDQRAPIAASEGSLTNAGTLPPPEDCEDPDELYMPSYRRCWDLGSQPLVKLSSVFLLLIAIFIIGFIVLSPLIHYLF